MANSHWRENFSAEVRVTIQRLLLAAALAIGAGAATPGGSHARFESRLSPEKRLEQALSRMTFGARPGDWEQVRRLGVEKWIEERLKPLSLRMDGSL
jgi:hypothetical protein